MADPKVARIDGHLFESDRESSPLLLRFDPARCGSEVREAWLRRWQDLGSYVVYRGGRLVASGGDMTGRVLVGGRVAVRGSLGGEREEE